jgi:hypothetical protein
MTSLRRARARRLLATACLLAGSIVNPHEASGQTPPPAEDQGRPVGEAPEERSADEVFLRGQRLLLGRGGAALDFGVFYGRSDDHTLATIGGGIALATVRRQIVTGLIQARVGSSMRPVVCRRHVHAQENRQFFGSIDPTRDRQNAFGGTIAACGERFSERARRPNIIATFADTSPQRPTHPLVADWSS